MENVPERSRGHRAPAIRWADSLGDQAEVADIPDILMGGLCRVACREQGLCSFALAKGLIRGLTAALTAPQ